MYHTEDFIQLLREMIRFFIDITGIQKEKLEAARKHNILKIEECMKKEQAQLLKFRGFEKKRQTILSSLSFENKTLREIIELSDPKYKNELADVYLELNEAIKQYRSAFDSAKSIIEVNLHQVNKTLADLEKKQPNQPSVYAPNGQVHTASGSTHFTSRKV